MGIRLTGSITISVDNKETEISADNFGIEEDGTRNLGNGDCQHETLFMHFDEENRFKILVQATQLGSVVNVYEASVEGDAKILTDELDVEAL